MNFKITMHASKKKLIAINKMKVSMRYSVLKYARTKRKPEVKSANWLSISAN